MLFGTEQEYGIQLVGVEPASMPHPMHLSNAVIRAYRDNTANPEVGFDFDAETPLTDSYGFHVPLADATEDLLTNVNPMANRMLTNGARFYVDHAHPEFSSPEVRRVRDAVLYDRAGDLIMQRSVESVGDRFGGPLRLYRNNTDGKGQSYGSHENYLVPRDVPFDAIVDVMATFLVSRIVITGAGRVGLGRASEASGFQLSQRADFFERIVGLETTMRRPIVNSRDEPHADPHRYRRLHVIAGDANVAQLATYLKIGSTALVLWGLEQLHNRGGFLPHWRIADPVAAFSAISHDATLHTTVLLADGRHVSALDLQEAFAQEISRLLEQHGDPLDGVDVVEGWLDTLAALRRDPFEVADRLDWVAKLRLLESFKEKEQLGWDAPRLAAIDLQYSEIDPARSLSLALERRGQLATLVEPDLLKHAMTTPPRDTRAYLRGELLRQHGEKLWSIGWDDAILGNPGHRRTLNLGDPYGKTTAEVESILRDLAG